MGTFSKSIWIIALVFSMSSSYASNISQFFPTGGGGTSSSLTIDQLLAKLPTIDSGSSSNIVVADLDNLNTLFNSGAGMKAVSSSSANMALIVASTTAMTSISSSVTAMTSIASSATAMNAVISSSTALPIVVASTTAMTAIAASTTAMTAIAASTTAMTVVAASSVAVNALLGNSTALSIVVASSTAMTAIAASSTAMGIVAASNIALNAMALNSTALSIMNASSTAMNALYAVSTKYNHATGVGWSNVTNIHAAKGLFVRMTTYGNPGGWAEGTANVLHLYFNGSIVEYHRATATNPYNQSSYHALRYYTTLAFYDYNPFEVAYIPL